MKVEVKLNNANIKLIEEAALKALVLTAEETKTDLQNSGTMPYKDGDLQGSVFVDDKRKTVRIVTEGIQARRLYFHPEYNFQTGNNSKAGALWYKPYIEGNKRKFVLSTYAKFLKRETGRIK